MTRMIAAAVIPRPHAAVEIREYPEPALEPDSALLEVAFSEVCGTDLHLRDGRLSGVPYPLIPGHVSVGRLSKIRGEMADVNGEPFREGDFVTFLDVHGTCGACWYCLVAKATTRCPRRRVYGITYGADDGLMGGWAEAVYLRPRTRAIRLSDAAFERFMAGGCGLPTAIHTAERAEVALGDTVLVLGCGPVGLVSIALAKLRGAGAVLCVGAPRTRLDAAVALGARDVLDFRERAADERLRWVLDRTQGRGADVVIEATGAPSAVVDAMRMARDAGRVVVAGQYTDHGDAAFNPHTDLNRKHLEIRGCWGSDYSHFHRAALVASDGALGAFLGAIETKRFGLHELNEALAAVGDGSVVKAIVRP
jgi:threonine dehydrogenase-like Zn-dependent dehydrogenase